MNATEKTLTLPPRTLAEEVRRTKDLRARRGGRIAFHEPANANEPASTEPVTVFGEGLLASYRGYSIGDKWTIAKTIDDELELLRGQLMYDCIDLQEPRPVIRGVLTPPPIEALKRWTAKRCLSDAEKTAIKRLEKRYQRNTDGTYTKAQYDFDKSKIEAASQQRYYDNPQGYRYLRDLKVAAWAKSVSAAVSQWKQTRRKYETCRIAKWKRQTGLTHLSDQDATIERKLRADTFYLRGLETSQDRANEPAPGGVLTYPATDKPKQIWSHIRVRWFMWGKRRFLECINHPEDVVAYLPHETTRKTLRGRHKRFGRLDARKVRDWNGEVKVIPTVDTQPAIHERIAVVKPKGDWTAGTDWRNLMGKRPNNRGVHNDNPDLGKFVDRIKHASKLIDYDTVRRENFSGLSAKQRKALLEAERNWGIVV